MTQAKTEPKFSRRSFIKGVAALTATGALAGCTPQTENLSETGGDASAAPQGVPETQIFSGSCAGNCNGGCFMNVHVRDGQIVRTTARDFPDTQYNRICSKGLSTVGRVYSSERLLYPMRRIEGSPRGAGDFERISWDEAIAEIAEKWKGYTDEFGSEAIAVCTGSGNYHLASGMGPNFGCMLFQNIIGASKINSDVDAAAAIGWIRSLGGSSVNEGKDYPNAKTIICWAANPTISQVQTMHFILEAKDKGARYIVIDPVYNANAAKADWYIPLHAGTDGALGFGILNILFNDGKIDEDILKLKTNAPFLIKEDGSFLRMSDVGVEPETAIDPVTGAEVVNDPYAVWDNAINGVAAYTEATDPSLKEVVDVNGIPVRTALENALDQISQYPPSRTAEITGVSEEDVRELARIYAEEGPVWTHTMMGVDHYSNGQYNTWTMGLVAGLTGNIGVPGGSFGIPGGTSSHLLNMAAFMPQSSDGTPCQGAGRTTVCKEALNVLRDETYAGEKLVIKSVFVQGVNPMCTYAQHDYVEEWFNEVDFVVVSEIAMTETAKYADILLPAAQWFEQEDIFSAFGSAPYIAWTEKAIEPLGEAKCDYDIHGLLCEALGYGDFWVDKDTFFERVLDTDAARAVGCTFADLKEKKAIKYYPEETFIANSNGAVPTETGRMGFYYDTIVMQEYAIGQEIDPSKETKLYWEEPKHAGQNSEYRKTYPYHLLSDHMRTRTHSQWFDCEYMKEYEPEPILRINPDDAAELGLADGDTARIYNDFGFVVMKVSIYPGLPPKMVSSPRSFQAGEFIDGHFGSLCSTEYNQVSANMAFNDVAVAIEKA